MACATPIRWVSLLTLGTNCPSIEQALEGLLASCNWSDSAGLVDAANITMNESVFVALLVINSAWTDDCFLVHFPVEKHKPNGKRSLLLLLCRPVRLTYKPYFFSQRKVFFFSQQISRQYFKSWLISQANRAIFFRGQVGTLLLSYEVLNEPCLHSFHGLSFIQWLELDCNSSIPTE